MLRKGHILAIFITGISLTTVLTIHAEDEALIPSWIRNTAGFWVSGDVTDHEFLNAIQFLIENDIIILNSEKILPISDEKNTIEYVIIPNGNSLLGNVGFYIPLNLGITTGTTVVWQNDDSDVHTVQSQDEDGKPSGDFNSNVLQTSDTFEHKFTDTGEYPYYCTLHPWRVGVVTVS